MTITAEMVKMLREATGAGMMECKSALVETAGDLEAAIDRLKARGLIKAARKGDRVATDGLVAVAVDGVRGAIVEVNSETDFVARNERFQILVENIAGMGLRSDGDVEALKAEPYHPGTDVTVAEELLHATATIGERIELRRAAVLSVGAGVVAAYVHNAVRPGMGRLGVLVALESTGDREALNALGRQIAMHVANADPQAVSAEDLDPAIVDRERRIFREQASASGKPVDIVERMVEGRVRKFYEDVALLSQTFVVDGRSKVSEVISEAEKSVAAPIRLAGFVRFALGEGVATGQDPDPAAQAAVG